MNAYLGLAEQAMARLDRLAEHSELPDGLTRRFLSPEHRAVADLVAGWMRDAGMTAAMDAAGNVVGRTEGAVPGGPALIIGSHLDTVRDAGKYDGMLGVISGIACVQALRDRGERPPFAIEVVGFGDEEGVRFQSTLLGSRALAGDFDPAMLRATDRDGVDLRQAFLDFGLDPDAIPAIARAPEDVLAYVELHIEQGPVLEDEGLGVGTVTAIASMARFTVYAEGVAGHAGTVPMRLRHDALAAAAECALMVERRAKAAPGLVGTVGRFKVSPGATNVIPGAVEFNIDLRAPTDADRHALVDAVLADVAAIAERRGVALDCHKTIDEPACQCAPWIMDQIDAAIAATGGRPFRLASGAGHDAAAMARITDVGMIFVRCRDGISHNPLEQITVQDAAAGIATLSSFIRHFEPRS